MEITINTGHHINGREETVRHAEAVVEGTLGHLSDHIARIEVHISDEHGRKWREHDKRCMMQARLEGHQPVSVTNKARTISLAISGAADKLKRSIDHTIGRLSGHEGRKQMNFNNSYTLGDMR